MVREADDRRMFLTDCPACGLRELRGPRSIELLVPTGRPVPVASYLVYRCTAATPSTPCTAHPAEPTPVTRPVAA